MARLFWRNKVIYGDLEGAPSVDPLATPAANAIRTLDFSFEPINLELATKGDEDKPRFGSDADEVVMTTGTLTFSVYACGGGAAGTAPPWGFLHKLCGYSEAVNVGVSVIYSPGAENVETGHLYANVDGILHRFSFGKGSVEMVAERKGYVLHNYTFQAIMEPVTSAAINAAAVDLSSWTRLPPVTAADADISFFGTTVAGHRFTIRGGQELAAEMDTESESIEITDRKSTYELVFKEPELATKDYYALASTKPLPLGVLNAVFGTAAGQIVTYAVSQSQITAISKGEDNGFSVLTCSGPCVSNTTNAFIDHTITVT